MFLGLELGVIHTRQVLRTEMHPEPRLVWVVFFCCCCLFVFLWFLLFCFVLRQDLFPCCPGWPRHRSDSQRSVCLGLPNVEVEGVGHRTQVPRLLLTKVFESQLLRQQSEQKRISSIGFLLSNRQWNVHCYPASQKAISGVKRSCEGLEKVLTALSRGVGRGFLQDSC